MRRTVRESLVEMTEIVLPEDTNAHGSIFGGRVLSLIDKCAAVVATRHARSHVLTVSLDSVEFRTPVHLGDVLVLHGRINAAFRSSMEIEVEVHAEVPTSGKRRLTTTAFVTLVAIDATGHPTRAPALELANDDERRRFEAAAERRAARLANR
ncbi:MAG: acyl-CoA thioesterase [Acidobacteriota bacterium]|nr:acyl-CoA thioesterase [Acidobacteriota bacterium]